MDIKHLPKLQTASSERRKRFLYVAIDRCSRWVHLAVKDDEVVRAFPFTITITHVLTDGGSCFTANGFEDACRKLKVEDRRTKPYKPQTNALMERFNGRVQREVLGITIFRHQDLETLLKGFNQVYNRRRQRVLKGRTPDESARSRLVAEPKLANHRYKPPDPRALPQVLQVVAATKEVSDQTIKAAKPRPFWHVVVAESRACDAIAAGATQPLAGAIRRAPGTLGPSSGM